MFELDGVEVRFGNRLALDVTHPPFDPLHLEGGATVAVMGPNGSGKTTLLRLLARLIEPSTGALRGPATVAYVAQHQGQHSWIPLTVAEVLRMGRYRTRGLLHRLDGRDRQIVAEAAQRLGVSDLTGRSFGELSGGQRQRVLVASALANQADALLLDEPVTGLDLPSQRIILDIAAEERDRGRLVVLTTHHLDEARQCDRAILLNTVVVAHGTPDEVLRPANLAATFGPRVLRRGERDETMLVFDEHGHGHR